MRKKDILMTTENQKGLTQSRSLYRRVFFIRDGTATRDPKGAQNVVTTTCSTGWLKPFTVSKKSGTPIPHLGQSHPAGLCVAEVKHQSQ